MKTVEYTTFDNKRVVVEYDETAPCRICNLPVTEASMGGTDMCPWCDMGVYRNGEQWAARDIFEFERIRKRALEILEQKESQNEHTIS